MTAHDAATAMVWLAQTEPSALPGWLTGGGIAAVLGWALLMAERRAADTQRRLDESEQRHRDLAAATAERLYSAIATLADAVEAVREMDRGRDDR